MVDDDRELRDLFARLREEDRARLPSFRIPSMPPSRGRERLPRLAIAAGIVLIALVLAWPHRSTTIGGQIVDLGTAAWESPTDFLLITPGSELLRTVPAVGTPDGWTPIDLPGRSPAPESTRSQRTPS